MARPTLYPIKKVVGFTPEMLAGIDDWRREQSPIPTVSDAIRQILEDWLIGHGHLPMPDDSTPG